MPISKKLLILISFTVQFFGGSCNAGSDTSVIICPGLRVPSGPDGRVAISVYPDQAVFISNRLDSIAVVFENMSGLSASYTLKGLNLESGEEVNLTGTLTEIDESELGEKMSPVSIEFNSIRIEWSAGQGRAFLYYYPERETVFLFDSASFSDLEFDIFPK